MSVFQFLHLCARYNLLFLGFFFDVQYFPALVLPAIGANSMGKPHFTAIAALYQVGGFECVLGASAVASAFGKFSFWKWNHFNTPVKKFLPVTI